MKGKNPQFAPDPTRYGGILLKTRAGRARPRPLTTQHTMHLVLRSTRARGDWSFRRSQNEKKIRAILAKFSEKHRVKIVTLAVVGNHLHLQVKLRNSWGYKAFIRATTAAIAMAVTGTSRWKKTKHQRFWDYRPFTRIARGYIAFKRLQDYIRINQLEGFGYTKQQARFVQAWNSS